MRQGEGDDDASCGQDKTPTSIIAENDPTFDRAADPAPHHCLHYLHMGRQGEDESKGEGEGEGEGKALGDVMRAFAVVTMSYDSCPAFIKQNGRH